MSLVWNTRSYLNRNNSFSYHELIDNWMQIPNPEPGWEAHLTLGAIVATIPNTAVDCTKQWLVQRAGVPGIQKSDSHNFNEPISVWNIYKGQHPPAMENESITQPVCLYVPIHKSIALYVPIHQLFCLIHPQVNGAWNQHIFLSTLLPSAHPNPASVRTPSIRMHYQLLPFCLHNVSQYSVPPH